jgi:hypothetical protein
MLSSYFKKFSINLNYSRAEIAADAVRLGPPEG